MQIIRVTQILIVFIAAIKLDVIECERTGKGSGAFIKYEMSSVSRSGTCRLQNNFKNIFFVSS